MVLSVVSLRCALSTNMSYLNNSLSLYIYKHTLAIKRLTLLFVIRQLAAAVSLYLTAWCHRRTAATPFYTCSFCSHIQSDYHCVAAVALMPSTSAQVGSSVPLTVHQCKDVKRSQQRWSYFKDRRSALAGHFWLGNEDRLRFLFIFWTLLSVQKILATGEEIIGRLMLYRLFFPRIPQCVMANEGRV